MTGQYPNEETNMAFQRRCSSGSSNFHGWGKGRNAACCLKLLFTGLTLTTIIFHATARYGIREYLPMQFWPFHPSTARLVHTGRLKQRSDKASFKQPQNLPETGSSINCAEHEANKGDSRRRQLLKNSLPSISTSFFSSSPSSHLTHPVFTDHSLLLPLLIPYAL